MEEALPGSARQESPRRASPEERGAKPGGFQCPSPPRVAGDAAGRGNGSAANLSFENYLPASEIPQQLSLVQIKSPARVPSNFGSVGPVVII